MKRTEKLSRVVAVFLFMAMLFPCMRRAFAAGEECITIDETPAIFIHVSYVDEEPRGDTKLTATVTLIVSGEPAMKIEGCYLDIRPGNGLVLLEGDTFRMMGSMCAPGMLETTLYLGFDESQATERNEDGEIVPTLDIEAHTDNAGWCTYHADFDVTPKARAVIYGADHSERDYDEDPTFEFMKKGPREQRIKNFDNMVSVWSEAFYDGKEVEIHSQYMGGYFEAFLDNGIGDPDDNDITYISINAHGDDIGDSFLTYEEEYTPSLDWFEDEEDQKDYGIEYRGHSYFYETLFEKLMEKKGRFVVVISACFAGRALKYVDKLDPERFFVLVCTDEDTGSKTGVFASAVKDALESKGFSSMDEITCGEITDYLELTGHYTFDKWELLPMDRIHDAVAAFSEKKLSAFEFMLLIGRIMVSTEAHAAGMYLNAIGMTPTQLAKELLGVVSAAEAERKSAIDAVDAWLDSTMRFFFGQVQCWGNRDIAFRVQSPGVRTEYVPLAVKHEYDWSNRLLLGGVVRDAVTHDPIEGATVRLWLNGGKQYLETTTTAQGTWLLKTCATYSHIAFAAEGYEEQSFTYFGRMLGKGTPIELSVVDLIPENKPGIASAVIATSDNDDMWRPSLYLLDAQDHLLLTEDGSTVGASLYSSWFSGGVYSAGDDEGWAKVWKIDDYTIMVEEYIRSTGVSSRYFFRLGRNNELSKIEPVNADEAELLLSAKYLYSELPSASEVYKQHYVPAETPHETGRDIDILLDTLSPLFPDPEQLSSSLSHDDAGNLTGYSETYASGIITMTIEARADGSIHSITIYDNAQYDPWRDYSADSTGGYAFRYSDQMRAVYRSLISAGVLHSTGDRTMLGDYDFDSAPVQVIETGGMRMGLRKECTLTSGNTTVRYLKRSDEIPVPYVSSSISITIGD